MCFAAKKNCICVCYLERGEHDSMLSMLDAGVHQVFNQADL